LTLTERIRLFKVASRKYNDIIIGRSELLRCTAFVNYDNYYYNQMIAFNANAGDKTFFRKQIFRETFKHFVFCSSRKYEKENYFFFLNSIKIITVIPINVYRLILNTYRSKQKHIRKIMKHRFNENRKVFD